MSNMKKTTLESVYNALKEMKYEIKLDENIRLKAKKALDRMIGLADLCLFQWLNLRLRGFWMCLSGAFILM